MSQIEVINCQCRKLPANLDQPDKTVFLAEDYSMRGAILLIWPLESAPARHVEKIAAAAGMDVATVAQRLSGRGFMMLKRSDRPDEIAAAAAELTSLGYRARMLRENMFFRVPTPRRIISARLLPTAVELYSAGVEQPVVIQKDEPVFVVIGDLRAVRRHSAIRQDDANPRPVATGSDFSFLSILDKMNIYHCDVYVPYKWLAFRLQSDRFNYSCLGNAATDHTAENLAIFLDRLAALPLKFVWDGRFPETVMIGMKQQFDLLESRASLMVSSVFTTPEEAPFNMYSKIRYSLELLNGLKCFS